MTVKDIIGMLSYGQAFEISVMVRLNHGKRSICRQGTKRLSHGRRS